MEEHTVASENILTLPPVERMCSLADGLPSVSRVSSVTLWAICIREQAALLELTVDFHFPSVNFS